MGTLLEVVDLKKYFPVRRGVVGYFKEKPRYVPAVDDVNFKVLSMGLGRRKPHITSCK